jgi:hypothetical protein
MLEMNSSKPVHLDGAVRIYDIEKMIFRLDKSLDKADKNTIYKKMWRLDGNIPLVKWKELITHYYRDNRLIGEYFDGEDEVKDFKPNIIENRIDKTPIERYVPYNMNENAGIRLAISYSRKPLAKETDCIRIRPNESILIESDEYRYIESDSIDIIKELRKQGMNVISPLTNTKTIAFEDTVINLPQLIHRGVNAVEMANDTNKVIGKFCEKWISKKQDRLLSYSICIEYSDIDVTFSIAGHIADIYRWINNFSCKFPSKTEEMGNWCQAFAAYLYTYDKSNDNLCLGDLINYKGIISFKRKLISEYKFEWDDNRKAVMVETVIENDKLLINEIKNKGLEVAPIVLINRTVCSKCKKNYHECTCSKYLEENVGEIMQDYRFIGAFWTNRKA